MKKLPPLFEDRLPSATALPTQGSVARGLVLVFLIFAGTRLVTWTATYYGATFLWCIKNQAEPPFSQQEHRLAERSVEQRRAATESFMDLLVGLAPLCRFDGVHYRSIIEGGYQYSPPPPNATNRRQLEQNIAFFPLYPLACRPLTGLLTTHQAMILVSQVCALAAAIILYLWIRRRIDEPTALFAVAATLCWPAAVYYGYGYAESVTLLTFVAALWLIDTRQFVAAAVVSGLATATRPTALAIAVVLLLAYWMGSVEPRRRRIWKLIPLGLVGAGGILAYAGYLTYRFGSPLIYLANFKAGWVPDQQRATWLEFLTLTPVWEQVHYFRDVLQTLPPLNLVILSNSLTWGLPLMAFILFLSLAGLGRVPRSFRPLLLLGPLIFLHSYLASGGAKFGIEPIARYMAVSVPAFAVLAAWSLREWRPWARHLLLTVLLLIQVAWAFRFGLQEWSG